MKKLLLIGTGFLPFVMGFALHLFITGCPVGLSLFFSAINIATLLLWGAAGFFLRYHTASALKATALAHLPALAVLLLILVQELILGHYWMNFLGLATQVFFLPLVYLPANMLFFVRRMPLIYAAAFCGMAAVFWLGGCLRERYAP